MYKPHRKPRPKSKTSNISKHSPSPLHHTFLLGRARFTALPLSALVGTTGISDEVLSRAKREGFRLSERLKRRLKLALLGRFSRCTYYFMASPVETRQRAVPFSQTGWRFAVCRNSERAASFQQTNSVLVKNFRKKWSTSQSGPS